MLIAIVAFRRWIAWCREPPCVCPRADNCRSTVQVFARLRMIRWIL